VMLPPNRWQPHLAESNPSLSRVHRTARSAALSRNSASAGRSRRTVDPLEPSSPHCPVPSTDVSPGTQIAPPSPSFPGVMTASSLLQPYLERTAAPISDSTPSKWHITRSSSAENLPGRGSSSSHGTGNDARFSLRFRPYAPSAHTSSE